MRKLLLNITASFISLIIGVLLSELAMRLFYPQDDYLKFVRADPILRTSNCKNFNDHLRFGSVRTLVNVKTNSRGMRGGEIDLSDTSKVRVLLLGDSFTFGWAMPDSESFAFLLKKRLNSGDGSKVEILNGSVVGWGTLQQILYLKQNWATLRPDLVVVTFVPNDILDDHSFQSWQTGKGDGPTKFIGKDLIVKFHLFRFFHLKLRKIMVDRALSERLKTVMQSNPNVSPERFTWVDLFRDEDWRHLKETCEKLYSFCKEKNTPLLIQDVAYNSEPLDSFFRDFAKERSMAYFSSLSPIYEKYSKDQLFISGDGHWTVLGNKVVAEQLSETLLGDSLLKKRDRMDSMD